MFSFKIPFNFFSFRSMSFLCAFFYHYVTPLGCAVSNEQIYEMTTARAMD